MIDLGSWLLGHAHYWRAWNAYQLDRIQAARADADRAKMLTVSAPTFVLSGMIDWREKRLDAAESEFQEALTMDFGQCEAASFLGGVRAERRLGPLPDEDVRPAPIADPDPDAGRCAALIERGLAGAIGALEARDRLRLSCYYTQGLTLAETGRLLSEHEATVSRQLARTRTRIRNDIERELRESGLPDEAIARCVASVADDSGTLDLNRILAVEASEGRREPPRSGGPER